MYLKVPKGKITIYSKVNMMFSEKAPDETFVKCASCRCTKGNQFFTYGLMSCDRCIGNKRSYNKMKSEENRLKKTFYFL